MRRLTALRAHGNQHPPRTATVEYFARKMILRDHPQRKHQPCPHGVEVRRCRWCGTGCPHGRSRLKCRKCLGPSSPSGRRAWGLGQQVRCPHGRMQRVCAECGGGALCLHGRVVFVCRECVGVSLRVHGRQSSRCTHCGIKDSSGQKPCIHGSRRYQCLICIGEGICPHGRQQQCCRLCGAFCVNGSTRRIRRCPACGCVDSSGSKSSRYCLRCRTKCRMCGEPILNKKRFRSTCKRCVIAQRKCCHGNSPRWCRQCCGSGVCVHGRNRWRCAPECRAPRPRSGSPPAG